MIIFKRIVFVVYFLVFVASLGLTCLYAKLFVDGWRLEPTTLLTKINKEAAEYEFGFVDTGYSDYSHLKDEYTLDIQTEWPENVSKERIEDIFANAISYDDPDRSLELLRKDPEVKFAYEVWIDGALAKEGKFKVFKFVDYDEPKNTKIVARIGEFGCKSGVICLVKVKILESPDDFYELSPSFLVSENEESKGRTFQLMFGRFLTMVFGGVFLMLLSSGVLIYFLIIKPKKKRKR